MDPSWFRLIGDLFKWPVHNVQRVESSAPMRAATEAMLQSVLQIDSLTLQLTSAGKTVLLLYHERFCPKMENSKENSLILPKVLCTNAKFTNY